MDSGHTHTHTHTVTLVLMHAKRNKKTCCCNYHPAGNFCRRKLSQIIHNSFCENIVINLRNPLPQKYGVYDTLHILISFLESIFKSSRLHLCPPLQQEVDHFQTPKRTRLAKGTSLLTKENIIVHTKWGIKKKIWQRCSYIID